MTNKSAQIWGHIIYYVVTFFGWFLILLFFVNQLNVYKDNAEHKIIEARPMTDWVEYIAVTPTKKTFVVGESLKFTSNRIVRQPIPLYFYDILFCDYWDNDGKQRVSAWESNNQAPRIWNRTTAPREYQAIIPKTPATCHLQSTVVIRPHDTVKMQTLESPLFHIK